MRHLLISIIVVAFATTINAQTRVTIFGDSYSTFQGYLTPDTNAIWYFNAPKNLNDVTSVEQTWWQILITDMGWQLERNNSFSGATVCNTGYNGDDYSDRSFITRLPNLGNPEIILVCAATNDSWANSPIGEYKYGDWTSNELYSFRPAMAKLCEGLRLHYPQSRVYFILNSELKDEINESIHTITKHYGIPCIDLHNIDKQQGHPSIKGMIEIAKQVKVFINK